MLLITSWFLHQWGELPFNLVECWTLEFGLLTVCGHTWEFNLVEWWALKFGLLTVWGDTWEFNLVEWWALEFGLLTVWGNTWEFDLLTEWGNTWDFDLGECWALNFNLCTIVDLTVCYERETNRWKERRKLLITNFVWVVLVQGCWQHRPYRARHKPCWCRPRGYRLGMIGWTFLYRRTWGSPCWWRLMGVGREHLGMG